MVGLDLHDYRVSNHVAKPLAVGCNGNEYEPYYVDWIRNSVYDAKKASKESSSHIHCSAAMFVYDLNVSNLLAECLARSAFKIGEVEHEQYYVNQDEWSKEESNTGES